MCRINALLQQWLPGGVIRGGRYHVLNPRRSDKALGSFSIDLKTGRWADFATGDKGGDLIALYAYINNIDYKVAYHEIWHNLQGR